MSPLPSDPQESHSPSRASSHLPGRPTHLANEGESPPPQSVPSASSPPQQESNGFAELDSPVCESFEAENLTSEPTPRLARESVPSLESRKLDASKDSFFWHPTDQNTLAVLLVLASLAILIWSGWQANALRTRTLDIDQTRRTPLRFVVDLNTAPATELASLPGVGPKLAEAIVAHRQQFGNFQTAEDLLAVNGIGTAKLRAILPYLRSFEQTSSSGNSSLAPAGQSQLP